MPALHRFCCHGRRSTSATELRQRIVEYRHLRSVTLDKQALEAIDAIIVEAEESIRRLGEDQTSGRLV
jgi:hypothetical protein